MYSIDKIIQDWCNESKCICMTRNEFSTHTINVYTNKPGYMIGYKGCLFDKYSTLIKKYDWNVKIVEFNEVHYPGDNWQDIINKRVEAYFELENCL